MIIPLLLMCDSGIEEENVVSEYLALLGEEELNRLEEIYRWKQHHRFFLKAGNYFLQEWFWVVWIFSNQNRISETIFLMCTFIKRKHNVTLNRLSCWQIYLLILRVSSSYQLKFPPLVHDRFWFVDWSWWDY